jgi:hypothetical protein
VARRSRALPRKKRRQPFTVKMDPLMNGYWGDNTYQTMSHQSALMGTPSIQLEIPYTMRQVRASVDRQEGWMISGRRRTSETVDPHTSGSSVLDAISGERSGRRARNCQGAGLIPALHQLHLLSGSSKSMATAARRRQSEASD